MIDNFTAPRPTGLDLGFMIIHLFDFSSARPLVYWFNIELMCF